MRNPTPHPVHVGATSVETLAWPNPVLTVHCPSRQIQPGVSGGVEKIGERFKPPLRHEPVAYRSTTVVSVLVYSFTRRHRSPAVSLSVLAQTADGADASERRSALLESDLSSQWPTAAVRWVGHQLADRRAAPPAVARSIRSSCARRRAARTQAGQGGSRWPTPARQRLLCRTSFWRPGLNGDPLTWRKAHPSRRGEARTSTRTR